MAKTKDFPLPVLDIDDTDTKLAFAPIGCLRYILDLQHELSLYRLRHAVTRQDLLLAEGQKQSTKDPFTALSAGMSKLQAVLVQIRFIPDGDVFRFGDPRLSSSSCGPSSCSGTGKS